MLCVLLYQMTCAYGNDVATGQTRVKKNVELRPLRNKSIVFFSIIAICPQVGYVTVDGFIFVHGIALLVVKQ